MFSDRLNSLMQKQQITREKLADTAGVSTVSIYNYCSGKFKPRRNVVVKLASALNVTVDYLLELDGEEVNNSPFNSPFKFSTKKITLRTAAKVLCMEENELLENIQKGIYNFAEARKNSVYISPKKFYEYTGWRY